MANSEHVAIVRQGAEALNQWREANPGVELDLRNADLRKADLRNANLSEANLSEANLQNTNLSSADLRNATLSAANLSAADLQKTRLSKARLSKATLDHADLGNTDLCEASLDLATLSEATLVEANLFKANLVATQALSTNFKRAILTGACIKGWNPNNKTNLEGVVCEYIFLDCGKGQFSERRPSSGPFAPGDFAKLVQKTISTVDLIFRNGINWEAFVHSFQTLQEKAGSDELKVKAIEDKDDGDFVIRVNAPPGADKAKIQEFVMAEYGKKLKAIEAQYEERLKLQGAHLDDARRMIDAERQEKAELMSMMKVMAMNQGPTNITANNIAAPLTQAVAPPALQTSLRTPVILTIKGSSLL